MSGMGECEKLAVFGGGRTVATCDLTTSGDAGEFVSGKWFSRRPGRGRQSGMARVPGRWQAHVDAARYESRLSNWWTRNPKKNMKNRIAERMQDTEIPRRIPRPEGPDTRQRRESSDESPMYISLY
ncbi:hypothetical protein RUM43_008676 [Polyplax serrata]|uniref:Uncharacterized protein n=1 Tax=Polyplax serrata TaxID=468196 RepID=A0AAN8S1H7_POLSC